MYQIIKQGKRRGAVYMTMTKKKINSWSELLEEVKKMPISEAAQIREGELSLTKRGNRHLGLCPFHNDQNIGSFTIGGSYNTFKCFSCGESGDIVNLIMEIDGISFKEALLTIATETGLMDNEDADKFKDNEEVSVYYDEKWNEVKNHSFVELDNEEIEKRHTVYSLLSEGYSIANELPDELGFKKGDKLSHEHYHQLTKERGLTDKQIDEAGFFTMTKSMSKDILAVIYYRLITELGENLNILNVPGFWRLDSTATIGTFTDPLTGKTIDLEDGQYYWHFDSIDALGIPIKDENGNINAIQLRPDNSSSSLKYIWFSSASANNDKNKTDGMSSGSPQDITYPDAWIWPNIFVTEGKFKSLALTRMFDSPSVSLQGVNSYKGLSDKINNMSNGHEVDISNILIAFDSDMSYNDAVINATINMVEDELSGHDVYIAVWDVLFGKGIDDMIHNRHVNALERITLDELKEIQEIMNKKHSKDASDIVKENRERTFYNWLKKIKPNMKFHSNRKF